MVKDELVTDLLRIHLFKLQETTELRSSMLVVFADLF